MTNTELNAMLAKVENAEQLVAELRDVTEDEEVMEVLKRYNLEMTLEDLEGLQLEEGELDPEDLDMVSGGCKCKGILKRLITGLCEKLFGIKCLDCM